MRHNISELIINALNNKDNDNKIIILVISSCLLHFFPGLWCGDPIPLSSYRM